MMTNMLYASNEYVIIVLHVVFSENVYDTNEYAMTVLHVQ